jgi:hypothetical protein
VGRDRTAARATLGGEFPARALSIREVGSSFHHGPRFRRPPCDPERGDFPSPVLPLASHWSPSHSAQSFSADPHTPLHAMVCFHGRSIVHRPDMSGYSWSCQVPRAPLHDQGVTSLVVVSWTTSAGVTPPSSLLRTHAPVLNPPRASVVPSTLGPCRLRSAPAGRRTFPAFSLRICLCVLGPLSRWLPWCVCPFLPTGQRPSPHAEQVGALQSPYPGNLRMEPLSRLQSFAHVQARRFARHPGCSYRSTVKGTGQPWLLRPRLSQFVTSLSSGYAHRPNRATDGRGTFTLQDSQPCWLLP